MTREIVGLFLFSIVALLSGLLGYLFCRKDEDGPYTIGVFFICACIISCIFVLGYGVTILGEWLNSFPTIKFNKVK